MRSISQRPRMPSLPASGSENLEVREQPMFVGFKGLDLRSRTARIDPEHATECQNLCMDDGVLRSRFGYSQAGAGGAQVRGIFEFVTPDGTAYLLRFDTNSIYRYNGTTWVLLVTPFTTAVDGYYCVASWGYTLLIVNGAQKVYEFNAQTGFGQFLDESPVGAKYIGVFGNRVIVANLPTAPYRYQWTAKNDSHDWDGIGSGYEDLFGTPGGQVDSAQGVQPITDDTCLIIREKSTWQINQTGDVDAPFRFTRIFVGIGTDAARTITETPAGYLMWGSDDVWLLNLSGPTRLGGLVRDAIRGHIGNGSPLRARGMYDSRRNEWRLAIDNHVWRYNFDYQTWTRDLYGANTIDLAYFKYNSLVLTIGDLVGTIGGLSGTIGSLVNNSDGDGVFFAIDTSYVLREDEASSLDFDQPREIILATGKIVADSPLSRVMLLEIQVEYECLENQTVYFETSIDNGVTWQNYSSIDLTSTTGPDILSVRRTIERYDMLLRLRAETLGQLRILSFVPRFVQARRQHA